MSLILHKLALEKPAICKIIFQTSDLLKTLLTMICVSQLDID